jgi:cell division protein ZapA
MGQVTVTVNGRRYDITCDDGQESHVERLAADIDQRVKALAGKLGALGDARLLLLAALLIADDLEHARAELAEHASVAADGAALAPPLFDAATADSVAALAARIEAVAARLKQV